MNGKRLAIGVLLFIVVGLGVWWYFAAHNNKNAGSAPAVGVGIALGRNEQARNFEFRRIFPNSPAAKAGLSPGQVLNKVNGNEAGTNNMKNLMALLAGPIGSKVTLEVVSPNGLTNIVELTRAKFGNFPGR